MKYIFDEKTAAALSYVFGPFSGIFFLIISKNEFVLKNAMQSVVVFTMLLILNIIFGATPAAFLFAPLLPIISILTFIIWLTLIYKAWQGDYWEVPLLSPISKKLWNLSMHALNKAGKRVVGS